MNTQLLIIGGGPAGYTAAIYASRAGLNPLVVEGMQPGGQLTITTTVDNYPGFPEGIDGTELTSRMREQAERFGARFVDATVVACDLTAGALNVTLDNGERIDAEALVIATGAAAKWLGLADEVKYRGMGVSACATCDGFFYRKKVVAVVGGGDTACEEATYLAQLASKVYMIVRKPFLRASQVMQKRVEEAGNIEVLYETNTLGLYGEDGLEGAHLVHRKGEADEHRYDLPIDGFFLAIGHEPNSEPFNQYLETDETGYIKTIEGTPCTAIPGVFAAGDVADPRYRQAICAAASGCKAALEAERWLKNK